MDAAARSLLGHVYTEWLDRDERTVANASWYLSVVELSYRSFDEWRRHSRSFTTAAAVGSGCFRCHVLDRPRCIAIGVKP